MPLSAASHSPTAAEGCQVFTATELVTLAIRGLATEENEAARIADELMEEDPDQSVLTATQALVARIEKSAHAS